MPAISPQDALTKLDRLYTQDVKGGRWAEAVRNRTQAAGIAFLLGQRDRCRQCYQDAIQLSQGHALRLLELQTRIQRFSHLLGSELDGWMLGELEAEIGFGREADTFAPKLVGALADRLDQLAAVGLAAFSPLLVETCPPLDQLTEPLNLAIQVAAEFSLHEVKGSLEDALARRPAIGSGPASFWEELRRVASLGHRSIRTTHASLRVKLYLLGVELKRRLNEPDTAEEILQVAESLSKDLPQSRCNVYTAWADLCESSGALDRAIAFARTALEAAGGVPSAAFRAQANAKLSNLLTRKGITPPPSPPPVGEGESECLSRAITEAHQCLLEGRFADVLRLADGALAATSLTPLRRMLLQERLIALMELGRWPEAEADAEQCLVLLEAETSADSTTPGETLDSRTREEETYYMASAWCKARKGCRVEAWETVERCRSRRFEGEATSTALAQNGQVSPTRFATVQTWLHSQRAAMVSFSMLRWGTLVLMAGPDDPQPELQLLEGFSDRQLRPLFESGGNVLGQGWEGSLGQLIPALSAGLIHPLLHKLRALCEGARVLYLVPDSLLYYVPFPALTLEDSQAPLRLIDLCPLAITPSATLLQQCASRRTTSTRRNCLAVAAGESDGFQFHDHLAQISTAPWIQPPTELRDQAATPQAVASLAPHHSVLYLSCHGTISEATQDILGASQIELAEKSRLTARDVAQWKLDADLVFLNACQAGRFRMAARSDISGFVQTFILAGARAFLAPQIHVNPRMAGDLAEKFFQTWLTGKTAAEALQVAQLHMRATNSESLDWASYCLTGDFV